MIGLLALIGVAQAADDPFALSPKSTVLPNGLTVFVEPDTRTDTVALHLHYGVGARDEVEGEQGCAHLFEHLMFEGSASVPTNKFDEWLTAAGGWNNAYTSHDETAYHMAFPSGALDLALFLESDRMGFLDAGLNQENVENQQKVVLQERAEGYAEPNGRDWDALDRLTWPVGHPYHVPVIGTVADIEGFQIDAVRGFWKKHYRPRNAVLAIVGNVDPDVALERVRHWFSDVPDPGEPLARVSEPPVWTPPAERHGVLEDDVEERTLWLVWPTVPIGHEDEPALDVLGYVLSYGRGTRLDEKLELKGIATGNDAFLYTGDIGGQFIVYASSERTPLAKLDKVVHKEIAKVAKSPPGDAEVERAVKAVKAYLLSAIEDPVDRSQWIVDCHRLRGTPDCLGAEYARYAAVTPEDVSRVAAQYLTKDRFISLSVVPRGDDGAMPGARPVELP
ncbi:MAG: zinc protease [Myxococcota bacterium]|jgi:zinc protease